MATVRPKGSWVLVWLLPIPTTFGTSNIVLSNPEYDNAYRTGVVVELGEGELLDNGKIEPMGIEKGDRVAFHFWNLTHKTGKAAVESLPEMDPPIEGGKPLEGTGYALIKAKDILLVLEDEEARAARLG